MGLFRGFNKNEVATVNEFDYGKLAELITSSNQELITEVARNVGRSVAEAIGDTFRNEVFALLGNVQSASGAVTYEEEPQTISSGFDNVPEEKKGNELGATLFDKLPKNRRHGSRFRTFFTDFERSTGIPLYEFHRNRIAGVKESGRDISKYPYRKIDSIFMVADEQTIYSFVKNYKFKFSK